MENILVSACLLGENCKYNGGNNFCKEVELLSIKYNLIPICPETFGGLLSPRAPAEIVGEKVFLKTGDDVTKHFVKGAEISLSKAKEHNCRFAVLKERSPSCGVNYIYNGMFNGITIKGQGITTKLLLENGIKIYSEEEISKLTSL